jgi:hypothetical protein
MAEVGTAKDLLIAAKPRQNPASAVTQENEQAYKDRIIGKQIETYKQLTPVGQAVWAQLIAAESGPMPKGTVINSGISEIFTKNPGGLKDTDIAAIKKGYEQGLVGHKHELNNKTGKYEATPIWKANEVDAKLGEYKNQVKLESNLYNETKANFSKVTLDKNLGKENVTSSVVIGELREGIELEFVKVADNATKSGTSVTRSTINGVTFPPQKYREIIDSLRKNSNNWELRQISNSDMSTIESIVNKLPGNKADGEKFISELKALNANLDPKFTASEMAYNRQEAELKSKNNNFTIELRSSSELKAAYVLNRSQRQVNSVQGSVNFTDGVDGNVLYVSQNKVDGLGNVAFFGGVDSNSSGATKIDTERTYIDGALNNTRETRSKQGVLSAVVGVKLETNPIIGNEVTGVKANAKVVGAVSTNFENIGLSANASVGLSAYTQVAKDIKIGVVGEVGTDRSSIEILGSYSF